MPPKRAFYIAQDTPNVSPKFGPIHDNSPMPSIFPLSGSSSSSSRLPGPGGMSSLSVPRPIRRPRKILYVLVILAVLYWFGVRHGLGMEREEPLPLGFAPARGHRSRPRTMNFARNGLANLLPVKKGTPEHPFYELMERAEENWRMILHRQSKTLPAAVKEYKRRYGIDPPAGFDLWFQYAQANNVKLVDEFDLMMRDVLAHHALDPKTYVNRSQVIHNQPFTYTLDVTNEGVKVSGPRATNPRPKKLAAMIEGFAKAFPPGFKVHISGSDHDVSSVVLGKDQRKRAMEHVRRGEHFTPEELEHYENPRRTPAFGWFKACPLDSPANRRADAEYENHHNKAFIHDHVATMDFCEFPQLKRLHGALCVDREDRSPSILKPWIVHSKLPGDASFLLPPIEGFTNLTEADIPSLGTWDQKLDARVHWRGSSTGGVSTQIDWRDSHRMRLHFMFNGKKGNDSDFAATTRHIMQPDGNGGYAMVERPAPDLAHAYGDVRLAGKPIQCGPKEICEAMAQEIDFAPQVLPKNTWMFRYVMDVDGNGWSERFHRLLSSASPVLKMTMFADWHMDRLIPWYHYIPIQPDYSDMYDVLSFFIGPLREDGTVDHEKGHDYLGHKIGQAGQEFSLTQWRWVDMQAYMFRLLLELARLQSSDRAAASYRG